MTEHVVTVLAVHVPDSQNPYAAECSCGPRWHVPSWGEATGWDAPGVYDPARVSQLAAYGARAKATFDLL